MERFFYYGAILTSGITGAFLLLLLGGAVLQHLSKILKNRLQFDRVDWIWPPATLLLTFLLMQQPPYAFYWLAFSCLYLLIFHDELRMPMAWAGASLCCFVAARYYHNGYLLEAGFPLAMALGVILARLMEEMVGVWKKRVAMRFSKQAAFIGIFSLLALSTFLAVVGKAPVFSENLNVIKIAIASNQNFQQVISYLQHELPQGAIVYELDEKEIGTTLYDRRHFPLKERAARVKIMNIADKLVMLRVLGRSDIKVYAASGFNGAGLQDEVYFIAMNDFEKEIARTRFKLAVIREFQSGGHSAAIYRVVREPEARGSL